MGDTAFIDINSGGGVDRIKFHIVYPCYLAAVVLQSAVESLLCDSLDYVRHIEERMMIAESQSRGVTL